MFTVAKAATAFITPLGASLLLGAAALVCGLLERNKAAAAIGGLALVWLWFWSTPVVCHALRSALEAEFPPVAIAELPAGGAIVVLGAILFR
jgi:hypothetical protein